MESEQPEKKKPEISKARENIGKVVITIIFILGGFSWIFLWLAEDEKPTAKAPPPPPMEKKEQPPTPTPAPPPSRAAEPEPEPEPEPAAPTKPPATERYKALAGLIGELENHHKALAVQFKASSRARRRNPDQASLEWGKWSAQYNRELLAWRNAKDEKLKAWGLGPGIPQSDEHQVAFDLGVATGSLIQLWSEYNAKIDSRKGDVRHFSGEVTSNLKSAKATLKKLRKGG